MYHLVYTSRAVHEFSAADLKKLLIRSRLNNGIANVTGILIYRDSAFLQMLEGDEPSVCKVFNRIEADSRHARVDILINKQSVSERRLFGKWSMGFANASSNAQVLSGFVDLSSDQSLLTLTDKQAMDLLSSCGLTEEYAAA